MLHFVGRAILILRPLLVLAVLVAMGATIKWIAATWPAKGYYAFFVVFFPLAFGLGFYLDRNNRLKHTDYWGDPIKTSIEYDVDVTPNTRSATFWKWYAAMGGVLVAGLWVWSAWMLFH